MARGQRSNGHRRAAAGLLTSVDTRELNTAFAFAVTSYLLFSALDVMTTVVALGHGLRERNSLGASLYGQYGPAGLWLLKGVVLAVIIGVLSLIPRRVAVWAATAFALWAAVAVVGNLHALR